MQHPIIVDDLLCLGQGDVTVVSYWMILLFFMQDIASPPKMDLSYNENTNFVTSSIIISLLVFSFCKFSVNFHFFSASRLISFLNTFSSEANMVKLFHLVLVHNCLAVGTARLCSQNNCKWEGRSFPLSCKHADALDFPYTWKAAAPTQGKESFNGFSSRSRYPVTSRLEA